VKWSARLRTPRRTTGRRVRRGSSNRRTDLRGAVAPRRRGASTADASTRWPGWHRLPHQLATDFSPAPAPVTGAGAPVSEHRKRSATSSNVFSLNAFDTILRPPAFPGLTRYRSTTILPNSYIVVKLCLSMVNRPVARKAAAGVREAPARMIPRLFLPILIVIMAAPAFASRPTPRRIDAPRRRRGCPRQQPAVLQSQAQRDVPRRGAKRRARCGCPRADPRSGHSHGFTG